MNNTSITHKPLRRSSRLRHLSRQHHEILAFVWKVREGIKSKMPVAELGNYCNNFWNTMLKDHFLVEEKTFRPLAASDDVLLNTMIEDHDAIRTKIEQVIEDPNFLQLERLADILYYHIRFEERNLYPHIESVAHFN